MALSQLEHPHGLREIFVSSFEPLKSTLWLHAKGLRTWPVCRSCLVSALEMRMSGASSSAVSSRAAVTSSPAASPPLLQLLSSQRPAPDPALHSSRASEPLSVSDSHSHDACCQRRTPVAYSRWNKQVL